MKVKIGKYPHPIRCSIFTDYMLECYGYINWPTEYTRYERFLEKLEYAVQWVLDGTLNRLRGHKQPEYIRIDPWDTWSMDHTLAPIILPMLKQLKATKHGAPEVDFEDVPEELLPTDEEIKAYVKDGSTDKNFFKRWDWIMDEMIYAFDCKANKDDVIMRLDSQEEIEAEQARISNGFRLFGKYYEALWD